VITLSLDIADAKTHFQWIQWCSWIGRDEWLTKSDSHWHSTTIEIWTPESRLKHIMKKENESKIV
jgi:hypothetical protein